MSKNQKRIDKLRRKPPPKDFTWDELVTVMKSYGFEAECSGGSHYEFHHAETELDVVISKPHPGNEMKSYQIVAALDAIGRLEMLLGEKNG